MIFRREPGSISSVLTFQMPDKTNSDKTESAVKKALSKESYASANGLNQEPK